MERGQNRCRRDSAPFKFFLDFCRFIALTLSLTDCKLQNAYLKFETCDLHFSMSSFLLTLDTLAGVRVVSLQFSKKQGKEEKA